MLQALPARARLDVWREVLSLEPRCATGIARLWHAEGRTEPARELLAPVYGRFTEGFGTSDLWAAKALLASSRQSRTVRQFGKSALPPLHLRHQTDEGKPSARHSSW